MDGDEDKDDDLIYIGKDNNVIPKFKMKKDLIEKTLKPLNTSNTLKKKAGQDDRKRHVACEFNDSIDFKDDLLTRNSKLKLKKDSYAPAKNDSIPSATVTSNDGEITCTGQNNSSHIKAAFLQSNPICLNNKTGKPLPAIGNLKQCIICCAHIEISEYKTHRQNCLKSNFSLNSGATICQICNKDITHMNLQRQTQHVNKCADKESDSYQELNKIANKAICCCPMCGQKFRTAARRQSHLKQCAAINKMSAEMVKNLMKQQEEEHRANLDAGIMPEEYLFKSKQSDKRPVKKSKLSNDEDIHLAMALSMSLVEDNVQCESLETGDSGQYKLAANQEQNKEKGQGKNKKRKQQETSTVLMTLSKDNAQARILQKMDKYIFSTSCEYSKTQTPPFKLKSDLRDNTFWSKTALDINKTFGIGAFYVEKLMPSLSVSCLATGSKDDSISDSQTLEILTHLAKENEANSEMIEANTCPLSERGSASPVEIPVEAFNSGVQLRNNFGFYAEAPRDNPGAMSLEESYLGLVNTNNFSDVTILTQDRKVFAHKVLLHARCPQLLNMMQCRDGTSIINLSSYSEGSVLSLLKYIYAGHISLPEVGITDIVKLSVLLSLKQLEIAAMSSNLTAAMDVSNIVNEEHDSDGERDDNFDENDWFDIYYSQREKLSCPYKAKNVSTAEQNVKEISKSEEAQSKERNIISECKKEISRQICDMEPNRDLFQVIPHTVTSANLSSTVIKFGKHTVINTVTATSRPSVKDSVTAINRPNVTDFVTATRRPNVTNFVTANSRSTLEDSVNATSRPNVMDFVTVASSPIVIDSVTAMRRPSVMDFVTAYSKPSEMDSVPATSRPIVMDSVTAISRPSIMDSVTATSRPSVMDSVTATSRSSVMDSVTANSRPSVMDSVTATSRPSIMDSVTATSRPSVMDSVTATSRSSVIDSVTANTRPSVMDSVTATSRSSVMDSVITTSRPSVMDSVTTTSRPSVMDSVTATSRPSVMYSVTATSRPSVMDSVTATSRPSIMDSVTSTSRPSVMDSVTATSRPSVMDSVTATSRSSVMDSVTANSRPSVMDSVTATSRPSVMDSVTATSRPSVMDSVTATSRPSIMDSVTATSRPSVMDSVTSTNRLVSKTVDVFNRSAVDEQQKSIEQSIIHSPNVFLFNKNASETVHKEENKFSCHLLNEDFETKALELNVNENSQGDSRNSTHIFVKELDKNLLALKANVEQGKENVNNLIDNYKVSNLSSEKTPKRKSRKKKVTLKDFQKIVNKVVSVLPTVSNSEGHENLTELLSNEDVEKIAIKIENDFTSIYQCADDSFFIPCILDPVEEDTDEITITFADIKEPLFKKRKPRKPKYMSRYSGNGNFTSVKKKSMNQSAASSTLPDDLAKEMNQSAASSTLPNDFAKEMNQSAASSTLLDDIANSSGRDLSTDLSTFHSSSDQISSNSNTLSEPVQQVSYKSVKQAKKSLPVIGMNLSNISKEISKQLTNADLGRYLEKSKTPSDKIFKKLDITGHVDRSDIETSLAPLIKEETQPFVKLTQSSVEQTACISSVCLSDDELFSDHDLSSPAAPKIHKTNTSYKSASDSVWSLSAIQMSRSPISKLSTSVRNTSTLSQSTTFRKDMQYPSNALNTETTLRRNEEIVKEKMFSIISDVVISNMTPQTADTIQTNNIAKVSTDKINLSKNSISLIPKIQGKSSHPIKHKQPCRKVLSSCNTTTTYTSPNHQYIAVKSTTGSSKNNKTLEIDFNNEDIIINEEAMSSKTYKTGRTKKGIASCKSVQEKKDTNQVTADMKEKVCTYPDATSPSRDRAVNKKTSLLSLAPSIYLANTVRQMESPGENMSKSKQVHSRNYVSSGTKGNIKEESSLYSSTPINTSNARQNLCETSCLGNSQNSNVKTRRGLAKKCSPFILSRKLQSDSWTISPVLNLSQPTGRKESMNITQKDNFEPRDTQEYYHSQPNGSVSKSVSLESSLANIKVSPDLVNISESLAKISNKLNFSASSGRKNNIKNKLVSNESPSKKCTLSSNSQCVKVTNESTSKNSMKHSSSSNSQCFKVTNESPSKNSMKHSSSSNSQCVKVANESPSKNSMKHSSSSNSQHAEVAKESPSKNSTKHSSSSNSQHAEVAKESPSKNSMKHSSSSNNPCVMHSKIKQNANLKTHMKVQSLVDENSSLPLYERLGRCHPFGYPKSAQDKSLLRDKQPEENMDSVFNDKLNGYQLVKLAKTPVNQKLSQRKKTVWREPSPFSPMPVYDDMTTPELKKAASQIGVRPLGKKRLRELLKHVYHATHQYETDSDYDGTPLKLPRCETLALKANSKAEAKTKEMRPETVVLAESLEKAQKYECVFHETEEKNDVLSSSQEYTFSDGADVEEESILQGWPKDDLPLQSQANQESLKKQLINFFSENQDLYRSVLLYKPLKLDCIKKRLNDSGIKIGMDKLMNFLDERCITFTLKNINKGLRQGRKRRVHNSKKIEKC